MALKDLVERFCIVKLANILWQCVEFSVTDRAEADWLTAERFVKTNSDLVDRVLQAFISQITPVPGQASGETLVEGAPFDTSYDTFVVKCGRAVWDYLYQPLQKSLGLPYYPPAHYMYIRFG